MPRNWYSAVSYIVTTPRNSTAKRRFCGKYAYRISAEVPLVEAIPSSEGQLEFDAGCCGRNVRKFGLFIAEDSTPATQTARRGVSPQRSREFPLPVFFFACNVLQSEADGADTGHAPLAARAPRRR